jgi:hypothetical protein
VLIKYNANNSHEIFIDQERLELNQSYQNTNDEILTEDLNSKNEVINIKTNKKYVSQFHNFSNLNKITATKPRK